MHLVLLTHAHEFSKKTNTGKLVCDPLPEVKVSRIEWGRNRPDPTLMALIASGDVGLLYPDSQSSAAINWDIETLPKHHVDTLILIDGTWQQARKIYNRSPYLHKLPRVSLSDVPVSRFSLRRNQIAGGLCTAECAQWVLYSMGYHDAADIIEQRFTHFLLSF